ncbi:MAG: hypothetical protein LBL53_01915 [Endomicrobium sp.]|jgi:dihydrofolate synthase/folylpolyglutamate synthase|nr:hypothetical protein [Endomicrobium sp.]
MNKIFFKISKEYKNMTLGLTRVSKFLESIGNPQDNLNTIHIAGTNGKGSTATFISEILIAAGYKTALYTSPHLINITERFKINGINITERNFSILEKKFLSKALYYKVSYFEYLTVLAFFYFKTQKVDIAIIETGLGGRLDATNIIEKKICCIITSISKEHQEILGNTIEDITSEKAGIIKKDAHVICGELPKRSILHLKKIYNKKIYMYGYDFKVINDRYNKLLYTQTFDYIDNSNKFKNMEISLLGIHQNINASMAIFATKLLKKNGYILTEKHIRYGIKNAVWPGRFEIKRVSIYNKVNEFIIDGAHNIEGINAFIKTFKRFDFSHKKRTFIFSVVENKNYEDMIKIMIPFIKRVILLNIKNERIVPSIILKKIFLKHIAKKRIYICNSLDNVYNILDTNEIVTVIGSLYLVGKVLNFIKLNSKNIY